MSESTIFTRVPIEDMFTGIPGVGGWHYRNLETELARLRAIERAAQRALDAVHWMQEHHPRKCEQLNATFDWSVLADALDTQKP